MGVADGQCTRSAARRARDRTTCPHLVALAMPKLLPDVMEAPKHAREDPTDLQCLRPDAPGWSPGAPRSSSSAAASFRGRTGIRLKTPNALLTSAQGNPNPPPECRQDARRESPTTVAQVAGGQQYPPENRKAPPTNQGSHPTTCRNPIFNLEHVTIQPTTRRAIATRMANNHSKSDMKNTYTKIY